MMLSRTIAVLTLLLFALHIPACERPEAAEIREVWQQFTDALNAGDGKTAISLLTDEVIKTYDRWLDLARKGTRSQLGELEAVERAEIIKMRNRVAGELFKLDGRAYLILAVNNGWYAAAPGDRPPNFGTITFKGDTASVELLHRDQPTGHFYNFVLVNDMWRIDHPLVDEFYNEKIAQAVKNEHSTEDNLIMRWEGAATGMTLKPSIWDPPR